ncbi:MAG: terminase small subunit [Candidatus Heimdallarchaeaceae archaeon]
MSTAITKHPGGRPTKYIPDKIYPLIEEYFESCSREQTQLPTIEGLALKLEVNTETLYEWQKVHPEFSNTLKKILAKQKAQLMNDGMYGGKEVNAAMAIFLLKANHGLKDTPSIIQQFNVGGKPGIEFIEDDKG